MKSIYDFQVKTIQGQLKSMLDYKGRVVLIVNTASQCGFTPQYEGLNQLHEKFKDRGFMVLGFPCNQFGGQEPGTDSEIAQFCDLTFKVQFPMFSKVDVNGVGADPLFQFLKSQAKGLLGSEGIKWNFTKFLIDANGQVVDRFAPTTKPQDLEKAVEKLLKSN